MATQALARFEVVAKLILAEGLRTVLELRPPHPSARAVPLPVRTHLACLKVQHDAVGAQRHRAADHLGLPGQVRQPAVHREVNVLGVVFHHLPRGDDVVGLGGIGCGRLGPKHRAYQHPKKDNRTCPHRASTGVCGMFENRHEAASKSSQTTRHGSVCCPGDRMCGICPCTARLDLGARCRTWRQGPREPRNGSLRHHGEGHHLGCDPSTRGVHRRKPA